jgi:hypothetical protein
MRPWHLIFGFVSIVIGGLIFLFPGTTLGESYWYYFFFLLIAYHTVGSTFFYLFRDNICSLTTRDPADKTRAQFVRKLSWTLISGIIIGSVIGWLFPDQLIPAVIGGLLRNIGWMPNAYIFATLTCFAFDSIEYKSHLRLEGLMGVAIVGAVMFLIYAPFAGGFESTILRLGFVDVEGVIPSAEVTRFMTLAFYLFDIILAVTVLILLPFVDVEKHLPEINAELLRRKKEAVLARGEEWVEPEELERREHERAAREREENRIADLKELCAKKGLDFETENAKYLAKEAKKTARKQKKHGA